MAKRLIGNIKGPKGDTGAQGPKGATGPQGPAGPTGVVDTNTPVTFSEASADTDIASGDTLGIIAGKLRKSIKTLRAGLGTLSTLKTTAKTNAVAAINELKDLITSLTTDVNTLNSKTIGTDTAATNIVLSSGWSGSAKYIVRNGICTITCDVSKTAGTGTGVVAVAAGGAIPVPAIGTAFFEVYTGTSSVLGAAARGLIDSGGLKLILSANTTSSCRFTCTYTT